MDQAILNFLFEIEQDWLILFMVVATYWGSPLVIACLSILVDIHLYLQKEYRRAVQLLITICGSTTTTFVIKYISSRERPSEAFYFESSPSFPSGHAALSMALYGFLIYLLLRHPHRHGRIFLITLLASAIILIGFSRVYLGVHYPSDVMVGYVIGFMWILISLSLSKSKIWHLLGKKRF